ncbi:dihydrofolate reductase family protein [bacterium]|nr:dihydrofolate reductase family protein [bacterium]
MLYFTLTVATSADGYISRSTDEPPQAWASAEEQALFFRDVEAADWAVMGRNTHLAADKPNRRRIIFSTTKTGWQRPTQLWIDPKSMAPDDLSEAVDGVHPLSNGLILGGTRVHDWFLDRAAIDKVHLTIEPVVFKSGLPIFTTQMIRDPLKAFTAIGFSIIEDRALNAAGTRYIELQRSVPKS